MLLFVVTTVPLQDTTYYRSSGPLPLLTTVTVVNKKSNQTKSIQIVSDPSAYLETTTVIFFWNNFHFDVWFISLLMVVKIALAEKKNFWDRQAWKTKEKCLFFVFLNVTICIILNDNINTFRLKWKYWEK